MHSGCQGIPDSCYANVLHGRLAPVQVRALQADNARVHAEAQAAAVAAAEDVAALSTALMRAQARSADLQATRSQACLHLLCPVIFRLGMAALRRPNSGAGMGLG